MNFDEFFSIKVVIANSLWRKTGSKKLRSFLDNKKYCACRAVIYNCILHQVLRHKTYIVDGDCILNAVFKLFVEILSLISKK